MLNERQKQLVEKHYDLINSMLEKFGLDEEEYYGDLAERLCQLALRYIPGDTPEKQYFYQGMYNYTKRTLCTANTKEISCGLLPLINDEVNLELVNLRIDLRKTLASLNETFCYRDIRILIEHVGNDIPCAVLAMRSGMSPGWVNHITCKMLRYSRRPRISRYVRNYLYG